MNQMVFRNYGGAYQLQIESVEDLRHVFTLPDARWAATSVPVDGLNCDPAFLRYLDFDKNGRIRPDEVREGVEDE